MRQDNQDDSFLIVGYDLRLQKTCLKNTDPPIQVSADPTIWRSARELSEKMICSLYNVERLADISNGLNLVVTPPPSPAPQPYLWAAFDAPKEIVIYMSNSFGLQHSLECESNILSNKGFVLLGYDIVDMWTQSSALFHFVDFDINISNINLHKLFGERDAAREACKLADELCPSCAPYQPVGVWILPT